MIPATTPSHTATYGYDAFGRRISKTVDGVTTIFLYDSDDIIAEYDSAGNLITKYVYGDYIDEPIRMEKGGASYYYNYDGLGSVTNLTDSTGTVAESYSYDVFGKPSATSTIGNRFMFTGREYDSETELYYYRARYYSAELGRFLQADPVRTWGLHSPYDYCYNNPITWVDPFGLDTYIVNRELGGDDARGYYDPRTHTYVVTTDENGEIEHTYSWGNEAGWNRKGQWHEDRPEDIKAAKEALEEGKAKKVAPDPYDEYVKEAYQERQDSKDESRHEWRPWENCKHETKELLEDANKKMEQDNIEKSKRKPATDKARGKCK